MASDFSSLTHPSPQEESILPGGTELARLWWGFFSQHRAWVNLYGVSIADQLPSDRYSSSETMLIPSGLILMGTRLPRVSVIDKILWKADSETEICVPWRVFLGWTPMVKWRKQDGEEGVELPYKCDKGQTIPWEILELEWSLIVVLYQGKGPRLCSLHLSLDEGYIWEEVMTLGEAALFN